MFTPDYFPTSEARVLGQGALLLKDGAVLFAAADGVTYKLSTSVERLRPDVIPGLKLWLRADRGTFQDASGTTAATASGQPVGLWADQSGHANGASQALAAARPTLQTAAINGLPAIQFDGTNDLLTLASRLTTVRTIVAVMHFQNRTTEYVPMLGDATSYDFHGGGSACGNTANNLFGGQCASPKVINGGGFVNGVATAPGQILRPLAFQVLSIVTTDAVSFGRLGQDRVYSWRFGGRYAEILAYDTPLTPEQRQGVERHLLARYALA